MFCSGLLWHNKPEMLLVVICVLLGSLLLRTEQQICFDKVNLNFLYRSVLEKTSLATLKENYGLHRTVSAIVVDESHTVEEKHTA